MPKQRNTNTVPLAEFFRNRALAEKESKAIPDVLERSNDILARNDYPVSLLARVWFREHSNIDDVLNEYIIAKNLVNPDKNTYISCVIRACMNTNLKRLFPYNTFHFENIDSECIGKFLILHPDITNESDLATAFKYFKPKNVKLCLVDMQFNNEINDSIEKLKNRKRAKYGSKDLQLYSKDILHNAMSDYYEHTRTAINLNIYDLTVEEMCDISNFEKIVRREMKFKGLIEDLYEYYAEYLLDIFKNQPEVRLSCKSFVVKPKYNLIGNYITPEQEQIIIKDVTKFYDYTNAFDVLRPLKRKYEDLLNPELDDKARKLKMRGEFYKGYLRMQNRNLPPYHDLYWIGPEIEENPPESTETVNSVPSTSQDQRHAPVMTYKKKQVCVKNEPKSSDENSNASTVVEVVVNEGNQVNSHSQLTPHKLLETPKPSKKEMQLIEFLAVIKEFIVNFRALIVQEFPHCYEILWMEKRKIFINYILHKLKQDPVSLRNSFEIIPPSMKNDAIALLENAQAEDSPDLNDSFDPIKTSTQQNLEIIPDIGAIEEVPIEEILVLNEDVPLQQRAAVIIEDIRIKQEEFLAPVPPQFANDSDVMCLGSEHIDQVILIDDSDSGEESLTKMLENDNGQQKDKYQLRLNRESQNLSENSPPNKQPTDESRTEFNLHLNQFEVADQQQALREKNQERTDEPKTKRRSPRNRKGKNVGQNFHFTDTSSQEGASEIEKSPFTFVRHSSNHQSSDLGTSCFYVEFQRISFKRQLNIFEVSFHLPQFSCYDVILKTHSDIKTFLNLNELEWETLTNNLYMVSEYEFEKQGSCGKNISTSGYENSIKKQLDLYFSTLSEFKVFQLFSDGFNFSCSSLSSSYSNRNVNCTIAVDPSMLNLISLEKH